MKRRAMACAVALLLIPAACGPAGHAGAGSDARAAALAFAQCMRDNGLTAIQ
jgi:hypothetical protein